MNVLREYDPSKITFQSALSSSSSGAALTLALFLPRAARSGRERTSERADDPKARGMGSLGPTRMYSDLVRVIQLVS